MPPIQATVLHAGDARLLLNEYYEEARRGIAEALLDALEDHARASNLSWIYLDSKDDLLAAMTFYRQRGYQPCERYNENAQATIFLRRALQPRS
jgi:GNAT superfamily N-acetyltransferase